MDSLRRAMKIPWPRVGGYALTRGFLDLRILMEKWICSPCGIWVIELRDHRVPSWTQTRSRVWSWSTKERLDLIREENRIKELILFRNLNAMIQVRTLPQNQPRERYDPRDSTIGLCSNLEDPLRRPQHNCGPIFKVFGWIQKISCDALGDLMGLGLELGKVKTREGNLTTKGIQGSVPYFLGLMESIYT